MSYSVQNIRNVCLVGHSGNGKTALAESLLFMTGAINRMGNSADGNTVCDYDPEEIRRQISISTAVAPLEYKGCKINLLDTPGAFDFSGEVMEALRAADAAILVCSAKDGISVGFEKVWKYCQERDMPRFIYISKTDEENSDYNATFNALRERYGNKIAPLVVPMWDADKKTTGLIDVLNKRAYEMQDFKRVEVDIPPEKADVVAEFNEALKESVAETSDEMMDKYFSGESFTYAEMIQGLRQGVRELSMFPVLFGSAINCIGSLMLMDYIVDLLPNPMEGNHHKATMQNGETEDFVVSPGGSGQFGDVWVRFEPQYESEDMIFAEEVFGGSVPKNFFPAVEKGLREAANKGVLAGYPLVGLKATLYDGSYHPVDSNEMAFKTAAQLAYKEGIANANPTILEPIGELKVTIPDSYLGDVMGDLNKRRGRVMGMNPTDDGNQILEAEVPMAEMTSYAIDLRSITQSRGTFSFHFVRYEEAPPAAQQKAIDDAKAIQEEG